MFIDAVIQKNRDMSKKFVNDKDIITTTEITLSSFQRFVLSPLVVETALELAKADAIENNRDYFFAPAYRTWIEWRDHTPGFLPSSNRHALAIDGDTSSDLGVRRGSVGYYVDYSEPWADRKDPILFDCWDYDMIDDGPILRPNPITAQWDKFSRKMVKNGYITRAQAIEMARSRQKAADNLDMDRIGRFLACVFALIATPRVTETVPFDPRKINKNRLAKNLPPLLSWEEVRINLDTRTQTQIGYSQHGVSPQLHHVRAHLRLARTGVQLVRPHWRGDPRRGVLLRKSVIVRAEDESGEWKGALPPPPKVIREME